MNNQHERAARDVPPGTSWAFTEHRSLAEVIAMGQREPPDRFPPAGALRPGYFYICGYGESA